MYLMYLWLFPSHAAWWTTFPEVGLHTFERDRTWGVYGGALLGVRGVVLQFCPQLAGLQHDLGLGLRGGGVVHIGEVVHVETAAAAEAHGADCEDKQ
jgi:hypothetical protein